MDFTLNQTTRRDYGYIHTYTHTYIHTYVRTYIPTYIDTYKHTYIHAYIHTYIHTYIHVYSYIFVHSSQLPPAGYDGSSQVAQEAMRTPGFWLGLRRRLVCEVPTPHLLWSSCIWTALVEAEGTYPLPPLRVITKPQRGRGALSVVVSLPRCSMESTL